MDLTSEFQEAASGVNRESLVNSLKAAKRGDTTGQLQVAATMTWVAFSCPDAISAVYDNIASVWLGDGEQREIDERFSEAPLQEGFWATYWAIIEDSEEGVIPSKANAQITSLAFQSHPELPPIAERTAQHHPRAQPALAWPPESGLDPDVLESCPPGSLGQTLHGMIVGHGYSQELVNRRLQELSTLPESLRRVNARVLHMHRPWQLVAGYDTADAHEIAFGGFQVAQFGLNQAAMVLATFATIGCFFAPKGFFILLYLIAEGWRHGENSPDFMGIDWDSEWFHSIETIRERHSITAFRSVFSRNLFEVF